MDVGQIVESTSGGKVGSALVTIILAGFLWVGKTTFEHVGQVAGILHQLDSSEASDAALRAQYDEIVGMLNERTKSRFTREDADKLRLHIKDVETTHLALKERFLREYASLKIEIANVAARPVPSRPPAGASYQNTAYLGLAYPSTAYPSTAYPSTAYPSTAVTAERIEQLEGQIAGLQSELTRLQRSVVQSRDSQPSAFETPSSLVAQPNLDRIPVVRR